ncbi:PKD domain-containing protein [Longibacter salinarum]|nr:PKD domain-containing protein [Longibacter salinarum]
MKRLVYLLLAILVTAGLNFSAAQAQDAHAVQLLELHGPRTLFDGAVANYRARVSEGSTRPIGFLWDFGDGIASEGSPVAHRYMIPGTYTVTVIAYNAGGRDSMTTTVTVSQRPDVTASTNLPDVRTRRPERTVTEPATSRQTSTPRISRRDVRRALFSNDPITPTADGYTWILASDLWNERLNRKRLQYRLQGLRVEVIADSTGRGSTAYRLIAGHFKTIGEALIARSMLEKTDTHLQLHAFAPNGLQLAVAQFADALDQLSPAERAGLDVRSIMDTMIAEKTEPAAADRGDQELGEATSPVATTSSDMEASTPAPAVTQPSWWTLEHWEFPVWVWFLGGIVVASGLSTIVLILYGRRSARHPIPQPQAAKKAAPPTGLRIDRRPLHMLASMLHRLPHLNPYQTMHQSATSGI